MLLLAPVFIHASVRSQHLSFHHLGIAEGLPSNVTGHACFDSTGFVWIATNDGLISFDGTRIRQYLKETHPALPRNEIGFLFCDSRNRIWICTNEGLATLNEQRRIERVSLGDSMERMPVDNCFEVKGKGMIATSARKTFFLPEGKTQWEPLKWFDEKIRKGAGIGHIRSFDAVKYMFVMAGKAMLVDFATQKILMDIPVDGLTSLSRVDEHTLLATSGEGFAISLLDIASKRVSKKYTGIKDTRGQLIKAAAVSSARGANGTVYISTRSHGLVGFDPVKELFYSYRHEPLNSNSISSDVLRWTFCHPNGYMVITSSRGMNFTNVLEGMFFQKNNFIDAESRITDGGVNGLAEDVHGKIWVKSHNDLFTWDMQGHTIKHIIPDPKLIPELETNTEAGTIDRDDRNNMWVTYNGKGLAKFDAAGRLLRFLSTADRSVPTNNIRITYQLPNRMILVGAENRLFLLHPETYRIDSFNNDPLLKTIARKRIVHIIADGDDVWIAASPSGGLYHYNFTTKRLKTYGTAEGLSSNRVYCIAKTVDGTIYAGTYDGLNIIDTSGRIRVLNKHNGLRHPRVENIVPDQFGKIWITNFNSLIRYDPTNQTFRYFDQHNGVSNAGFGIAGNTITRDGRILFSNSGVLVVDPAMRLPSKEYHPSIAVHRFFDDGGYELLHPKDTIRLSYNQAKLSLYYLSSTLVTASRFFYRYKMDGLDTGWQLPTKNNQVTYNLRPGKYYFLIQASYNEGGWAENDTMITIIVSPPWWQEWWFRILMIALIASIVFLLFRRRVATIKARSAIKQQMAELEGKALRAQMNPHFIFNSLNAIQELIVIENYTASYEYLSKFSKLLRLVLNNSEKNFIPLSSEIEMNGLYLELESLRFKRSFHYSIQTDDNTDTDTTLFPSLLLQPFIENAIWHGLMHKDGEKKLAVSFSTQEDILHCVIQDNGIGRARAAEIKAQKLGSHHFESKGTELAQQRIQVLRKTGLAIASIETHDVLDQEGMPAGTIVEIKVPIYKNVKLKP